MMKRPRIKNGFSLIELLVVLGIISILFSLMLPVLTGSREAARRSQCENNLKQVMIAFHHYANSHLVFPPGVVNPAGPIENINEGYHVSWIVQLLPGIERSGLASSIDTSVSVYHPVNKTVRKSMITTLICPSDQSPLETMTGDAQNNFVACHSDVETPISADDSGVFFLNSRIRDEGIPDGSSQTIFVGEKLRHRLDLGWMSGTRATLRNAGTPINSGDILYATGPIKTWGSDGLQRNGPPITPDPKNTSLVGGFASQHPGGANFGFGDGSVRFVSETLHRDVFRRLANRADGEMISDTDY